MKSHWFIFIGMIILMVGCASSSAIQGKWEKLGQRVVNYNMDKDEIVVTRRDGKFRAIKLTFKGGRMNMHKCIIHYAHGEQQNVNLKNQYGPGDETRVIDLTGNSRIVSKVVLWYDTKNPSRKKATVNLWGLY